MALFPNQKTIQIRRTLPHKNFMVIDRTNWIIAAKRLTYSAFKLWMFLCSYGTRDMAIGPAYIKQCIGISESSYRDAMKELEKYEYITQVQKNTYLFNEFGRPMEEDE